MKKDLLVTLADESYIAQAKQLFSSVYWNAGWKGDFMLLTPKTTPGQELEWFKKKGILIKKCEPLYTGKSIGKWPSLVLSKCCLFSEEFKRWKNVIFLDSDIIVRASLEDLTNLKGFSAIRGHDKLSRIFLTPIHLKLEKIASEPLKQLKRGLDFDSPGFNTGVLAFNTEIIEKDTFDKVKSLINRYFSVSASGEEAILNILFYKKWAQLSEVYNLYPKSVIFGARLKAKNIRGIILHFAGDKPWDKENPF